MKFACAVPYCPDGNLIRQLNAMSRVYLTQVVKDTANGATASSAQLIEQLLALWVKMEDGVIAVLGNYKSHDI